MRSLLKQWPWAVRLVRRLRGTPSTVPSAPTATPIPFKPAVEIIEDNLALVIELLEDASVTYALVPSVGYGMRSVAVSENDRAVVIEALTTFRPVGDVQVEFRSVDGKIRNVRRPEQLSEPTLRSAGAAVVPIWRFYRNVVFGERRYGPIHACDIEFWKPEDGTLRGHRVNRLSRVVPMETPAQAVIDGVEGPTFPAFAALSNSVDEIAFPIDVVYTWVDGEDPAWLERKRNALGVDAVPELTQSDNAARYMNRDELRYSMRALALYAPWVRHVYLVTDNQCPSWLNTAHPRLTVVDHTEIFGNPEDLPTYNSHAIESQLHHIEGLSEHYLYVNDDVFLGKLSDPKTWFLPNGVALAFPSQAQLPYGAVAADDVPVDAAGKNVRRLIEAEFGRSPTQKFKHCPIPQRRSTLYEMEQRWPKQWADTASHKVRHPDDLAIASQFHHHYSYAIGRTQYGQIRYQYVDVGATDYAERLDAIGVGSYDAFCVNDTSVAVASEQRATLVREFLERHFPGQSDFERSV